MKLVLHFALCVGLALLTAIALPKRHFAPDGTFFVLEHLNFPIEDGVYGVPPGTKVIRLSQSGEGVAVTDGVREFAVLPALLTNDLDIAAHVRRRDESHQAAIIADRDERLARDHARLMAESAKRERNVADRAQRKSQPIPSALTRGAYDQKYGVAHGADFYSTGTPIYRDKQGRAYWIDSYGNVHFVR